MLIKQANVQPIIGIETNATDGKTVHVLDLVISAKDINPADFKNMRGRYDVIFKKAPLPPKPKKYVVEYWTWAIITVALAFVMAIIDSWQAAIRTVIVMLGLLGVVYVMVWAQNKYKVDL